MIDYFDCHADTLTAIKQGEILMENTCDVDLKRIRKFAGRSTQIFALWKDAAAADPEHPEEEFRKTYNRALKLLGEAKDYVALCTSGAEMEAAHKAGKTAAFLSVEDISVMGKCVEDIRKLGIRFAMLTWNYENRYACGSKVSQKNGLTPEGRELVKMLIDQKIILDFSHLSDKGAEDILLMTDTPVIASHSNVRKICPHSRNLTDELIREIIRRKGLIGMNYFLPFVGEQPSISDVLRHMDAVLALGGEDVLALGGDFDGCSGCFPEGICGVESVPTLRRHMEKAGFGETLIDKILFENGCRFVKENLM